VYAPGQTKPQVLQPLKIVHIAVEMAPIAKVRAALRCAVLRMLCWAS
jgi:hypothetical protein